MKFAAVIEYIKDKAKVDRIRPEHRQYLTSLKEKGQLAISGPFTDDYGALIVYEANSREEAETLLKGDPFHKNGIFVQWVIRPWNPVFANMDLFPK
ncbi:MAG: YciI family protein [Gemmataceae bacterium]|nr:YciI family protein [Gemmataceae bacterium]